MLTISRCSNSEFSREQAWAIVALLQKVWPSLTKTMPELVDDFFAPAPHKYSLRPEEIEQVTRIVMWDDSAAIAHAEFFPRQIRTPNGELQVMASARLCVDPERRGENLGDKIARLLFERVDEGQFDVTLFQTFIPHFFEKFGARMVNNRFVNSKNSGYPDHNPWTEDYVMIYPAGYDWPDGQIDINGPDY